MNARKTTSATSTGSTSQANAKTSRNKNVDALELMKRSIRPRLRLLSGRNVRQCGACQSVSLDSLRVCPSCGHKHV